MDRLLVLKAIADETRMNILLLLLQHNHCVRALARKLRLSEAAISQHLKVLREAGLLTGEKLGYFMHHDVNRHVLHELAADLENIAAIERKSYVPESVDRHSTEQGLHHEHQQDCCDEVKELCHESAVEMKDEDHNGSE